MPQIEKPQTVSSRIVRQLRKFKRAETGVAAVEFAFIAPVLMIMFFGIFEAGRAYSMHRRFTDAANMIGDLVTREKEISDSGLQGIYRLVPTVLAQFSSMSENMRVEIIPIHMPIADGQRTVRVYAQPRPMGGTRPACSTYSVSESAEDVLENSSFGLIVVRSTYAYRPLFNYPLFESVTWEHEGVFAPRQACVSFEVNNRLQSCNTPCS